MAKIAIVLHIPNTSANELKQIVRDIDVLDSSEEDAITVENVTAEGVLALILSGQYNPPYRILLEKIENCLSSPCGDHYHRRGPDENG
jgi:hypothetical protein